MLNEPMTGMIINVMRNALKFAVVRQRPKMRDSAKTCFTASTRARGRDFPPGSRSATRKSFKRFRAAGAASSGAEGLASVPAGQPNSGSE
jgi:hypothetical protein